ncbi:MAG: hypothetical protein ACE5WD_05750 [Candidatus Aminicenantia bacterium]
MKIKFELICIIFITGLIVWFCSPSSQYKITLELSTPTKIDLSSYQEIILTSFRIDTTIKDIDFNKELIGFFSAEFKNNFEGDISEKKITWNEKNLIRDQQFWQTLTNTEIKAVFFTGQINFKQELRKAILGETRFRGASDFPGQERKLAERLFFTLNLDLYLIETQAGTIIYQKNFKESKGYKNIRQTPDFAFYNLLEIVKTKLFRDIIAHKKVEERYLILN